MDALIEESNLPLSISPQTCKQICRLSGSMPNTNGNSMKSGPKDGKLRATNSSIVSKLKRLLVRRSNDLYGHEQSAAYYDNMYAVSEEYDKPFFQSRYYFLWAVIMDRLRSGQYRHLLEVGCGSGQFAEFVDRDLVIKYTGLDLSATAIEHAQAKGLAEFRFETADALTTPVMETDYDALVCTEVLEHIDEDRKLIQRFKTGVRCICTVPSFPYESHVRHFCSEKEVSERYSGFFNNFTVWGLASAYKPGDVYYLFDGVKN